MPFWKKGENQGYGPQGAPPKFEPTPAEMLIIQGEVSGGEVHTNFGELNQVLADRGVDPARIAGVKGAITEGRKQGLHGGAERH